MTRNASFIRKIVYISIMALLLLPLSYLGQPSGLDADKHGGGKLDQLRRKYDLSQSSLGEVDPTSETMKLATLGMRGVATTILWQQANEHKKKENWDAFATVLRQISKLQPHFIKVWIFQSWNQSYNVSVEFDDFRYRYHWVKKGISYLIEGTRYNQRDVRLQGELGRVFGHKIGRSDERSQFRRLFRVDHDFHDDLPINPDDPDVQVRDYEQKIDNWLVAREFSLRAIRIARSPRGSKELGASEVLFYSEPAMKRMSYAETIIKEGYFEEPARLAWKDSGDDWEAYGDLPIPTSVPGLRIELRGLDSTQQSIDDINEELDRLTSELDEDIREAIRQEKIDALIDEEREAFDMPEDERNDEQRGIAAQVEKKLEVGHAEIFERAPEEFREDATQLILQLEDLMIRRRFINSYRSIVNYEYWATRCAAEQNQKMLDAQKYVYEAPRLYSEGALSWHKEDLADEQESPGAKQFYERAWDNFADIFRQYPVMLDNPETEDLLEHVKDYQKLLGQLNMELPEDFKMQIIIDMHDTVGQRRANSEVLIAEWIEKMNALDPRTALPRPPSPLDESAMDDKPEDGDATKDSAFDDNAEDPRTAEPSPPVVE